MIRQKIAFFDMDGTLAAPRYLDHGTPVIGFDAQGWIKFCQREKEHAYDLCAVIEPVLDFAKQLKANDYKLFILTVALCPAEQAAKHSFIQQHRLGELFDKCIFVDTDDEKLDIMDQYANNCIWPKFEIILVEDFYYTCLKAHERHFKAIHVSNIITNTITG